MNIKSTINGVCFENSMGIDLGLTFDCGQCFRWAKKDNYYIGTAYGKTVEISAKDGLIYIEGTNETDFRNIWAKYLDLNTNYQKITQEISNLSPEINQAVKLYSGIHILNQEPWEALCSFIISQNNNIPRIKKIIESLCENFGQKISNSYAFPSAKTLSRLSVEDLSVIKSGFRAKYIIDAAQKVVSDEINLEKISKMPLDEARKALMTINGVGPKVAECVLLYGMHRLEAFPLDVWMKRVMETLFKGQKPTIFGPYAGVAQQYLYHYSRMNPEKFKD